MEPAWLSDEYKRIDKIHHEISEQTGASVLIVGKVWQDFQAENANIKLLSSDGNHASPAGNYLNACIFYAHLMNASPAMDGEDTVLGSPRANVARQIESVVWENYQDRENERP